MFGPVPRGLAPILLACVLALLGAGRAAAAAPLRLDAGSSQPGWVALTVHGTPGATVALAEGGAPLGTVTLDGTGTASVPRATRWRCDRRARTFTARASDGEEAAAAVTTASCRDRLTLGVGTARPRAGRRLALTLGDRFRGDGARVRLCLVPPRAPSRCRTAALRPDAATTRLAIPAPRPGRWTLRATPLGWSGTRARGLRVRPHARGPLRIVAAGDSMMQIVDDDLAASLKGRARVRRDAHVSTGISKPSLLNWPVHAARQARTLKADVTLVFLGANEGFSFGDTLCCGPDWQRIYARKARGMMAHYARGGAAQVYWLTLPAPRSGRFRTVFVAVNAAILRAASSFAHGEVRVLRDDRLFTPGYRFRASMPVHGRVRRVRQDDGVHLNPTGAALAAGMIRHALQADGIL